MPTMKDHPIPIEGDRIMSHVLVLPTRMDAGSRVTLEKSVLLQQWAKVFEEWQTLDM